MTATAESAILSVEPLKTKHLDLDPIRPDDYSYLVAVHEQSSKTTVDDVDQFETVNDFIGFIASIYGKSCIGWIIRHRQTGIPLGTIYFANMLKGITADVHPVSDIAALKDVVPLDESGQRIRTMDEAAKATVPYIMGRFDLQRIGGAFGSNNVPAIKLCHRLGFRKEGVIRKGLKIKGKPVDLVVLGITAEEVS